MKKQKNNSQDYFINLFMNAINWEKVDSLTPEELKSAKEKAKEPEQKPEQ